MNEKLLYDRFLDLHVTHQGHYAFHDDVEDQIKYKEDQNRFSELRNLTPWGKTGSAWDPDDPIDLREMDQGYVAATVDIGDIACATARRGVKGLLAWVGDVTQRGKIRLNVHGDGRGNISMSDAEGNILRAPGDTIGDWLHANGLPIPTGARPHRRGLTTLAMAICMGARHEAAGAALPLEGAKTAQAASKSVVSQCIASLRRSNYRGVEVTASNETVLSFDGQIGRVIVIPRGWQLPDSDSLVKELWFPRELLADAKSGRILIPATFKVTWINNRKETGWRVGTREDELCFLAEMGWYVESGEAGGGVIHPPLGWVPEPREGGGGVFRFKLESREHHLIDDDRDGDAPPEGKASRVWFRLAKTAMKSRDFS